MLKVVGSFLLFFIAYNCYSQAGKPTISAILEPAGNAVRLEWSMIDAEEKTAYIVLKSVDGIHWSELVRDRIFRNYTSYDGYTFEDENIDASKTLYRLKIINALNNTVGLSGIVVAVKEEQEEKVVEIPHPSQTKSYPSSPPNESAIANWKIYPNPIHDVLTLNYTGNQVLQGVINVLILDVNGKIVIRFRSASNTKLIQIPVDNIARGSYLVQISVTDEVLFNQRIIKQ